MPSHITLSPPSEPDSLLPPLTFVLWALCLGVGAIGLVLPYPPLARESEPAPVVTAVVAAHLAVSPPAVKMPAPTPPPPTIGAAHDLAPPSPAPPIPMPVPQAPAMAVALPSAAIAFAVPAPGFTHVVDAKDAGYRREAPAAPHPQMGPVNETRFNRPAPAAVPVAPAVTHLTFGEGEGNQPPPEYPRDAQLAGQQGSVGLRFTVDQSGRVTAVAAVAPSHWPLLNRAAIRVIRDRWRFSPGSSRTYEVSIEFQLQP